MPLRAKIVNIGLGLFLILNLYAKLSATLKGAKPQI